LHDHLFALSTHRRLDTAGMWQALCRSPVFQILGRPPTWEAVGIEWDSTFR